MFAKVFGSIFDGSMRGHADLILVFVNLLCAADQDGIVDRHWQAIVDETGLSADRVKAALCELESPDPGSRSRNDEGRRLKRIDPERDWGWQIINHKHYRALRNADERREYMRNLMREKRKREATPPVSNPLAPLAHTEAEAEVEAKKISPFESFWKSYPRHVGKVVAEKKFKQKGCDQFLDKIIKAISDQIQSKEWKNGYIPNPATWLNQERWNDEVLPSSPSQSTPSKPKPKELFEAARRVCVEQFKRLIESKGTADDGERLKVKLKDQYRGILVLDINGAKRFLIQESHDIARRQMGDHK